MKRAIDANTILFYTLILILALIALGTLIAFAAGKRPGVEYRRADPQGVEQIAPSGSLKEFKEFGTLRIRTLPPEADEKAPGSVLVVTPWLSYQNEDSAFYEELFSKKRKFATIFQEFFSSRTKAALLSFGEKKVKEMLLAQFNSELTLGKLSALYFDDYLFLD